MNQAKGYFSHAWLTSGSPDEGRESFPFFRGHLHMLVGRNGCGKSTLIKAIGGLAPVSSGEARSSRSAGPV